MASLLDLGEKVKSLFRGPINAAQQNITPAQYFIPRIANTAATIVQGRVSPVPVNPIQQPVQAIRDIGAATIRQVGNDLPGIGQSVLRLSPPGLLYTQTKGAIFPQLQPQIQQQRVADLYQSFKGIGYLPQFAAANIIGGGINMGIEAVKNTLSGRPTWENYDQNFARGFSESAPFNVLSPMAGLVAQQLPVVGSLVRDANMARRLPQVVHGTAGATARRALGAGIENSLGGAFGGLVRPLEQGESRRDAVAKDAAFGFLLGAIQRGTFDVGSMTAEKIVKEFKVGLNTAKLWVSDINNRMVNFTDEFGQRRSMTVRDFMKSKYAKGGYVDFGADITGTQSPTQTKPAGLEVEGKVQSKGKTSKTALQQGVENPSLSASAGREKNTSAIGQQQSQLPPVPSSPSGGSITPDNRGPQTLNVNRTALNPEQKQHVLDLDANGVRKVLSNDEIKRVAKSAGFDTKSYSTEETARLIAQKLNVRRRIVELENARSQMIQSGATPEELAKITSEIAGAARTSRMQGTQAGRELQARKIMADELNTPMMKIFQLLDQAGVNPDKYEKAAATVDFRDAQQAVRFYRQFAPAEKWRWVDTVRYNSMLSSPNTWINNAFSNAVNTGIVAPVEKTITGAVDFLAAPFRGGKRNAYIGEGAAYTRGYYEKMGTAAQKFVSVLRGKNALTSTNLDTREIPLVVDGPWAKTYNKLSFPTRILEGTDQFFRVLTEGGETAALKYRQGKGVNVGDIASQAEGNAAYRLFRGKLKDERQGVLLNGIDELTGAVQRVRNSKNPVASTIAKFTLPFVQTPMNIFKQMVEYSPAGLATIPGAQNKTEQLSKAIMGTAGMAATMMLLESGRMTWTEPTDPKKKAAFRAAGMQPYAVKVGNNWISYTKLPPALSIPLALTAAVHDAHKNKLITDNEVNVIMSAVAKFGNFYADQSYVKQIGDAVASVKGDVEGITRMVGNYTQQLVPYRALLGWMARLTDPYQRKVDTDAGILEQQVQSLMTQLPIVSMQVPARVDALGNPIPNQNRVTNAFSPLRVTTERPGEREYYDVLQEKSLMDKNVKAIKKQAEKESVTAPQVQAADEIGLDPKEMMRQKAQDEITKAKVEISGKPQASNGKYFYITDNGAVGKIELNPKLPQLPLLTGSEEIDKKAIAEFNSEINSQANNVYKLYKLGQLTQDQANTKLVELKKLKTGTGSSKKAKKIAIKAISVPKTIKLSLPKAAKMSPIKIAKPPKVKAYKPSKSKTIKIKATKPVKIKKLTGL